MRGLPAPAGPQQHLQQLGRLLDLGQAAMVGALGALVSVMRRVSHVISRDAPGTQAPVARLCGGDRMRHAWGETRTCCVPFKACP